MLKNCSYYENILGESPTSFINIFKNTWNNHIKSFPKKYIVGEQFIIGDRFRPVILCWGYILTCNSFDLNKKKELSSLALHIELLHKATLLIDDLIDNDLSRHGKKAFHVQYSKDEAILFAIYLLGDSLERLHNSLNQSHFKHDHFEIVRLFSHTIKEMAYGALREVSLNNNQHTSIETIQEIIENQTISIIKNGFLTGYMYGDGRRDLIDVVDKIGYDCGYIFQLLNDLEPFGSISINSNHKGRNNIDVLRSRKNLTVAFIYNSLKPKDKKEFQELINKIDHEEEQTLIKVFDYYTNNNVLDSILNNLIDVRQNIDRNIGFLEKKLQNVQLMNDFKKFLTFVFLKAIDRVGTDYHIKLSDILIK